MKKTIVVILITFFYSCTQPPEPPKPIEIYNKYRNSIVLIKNSYYFITVLDNDFKLYYSIINNEPVFFNNEQEAIENASVNYGTGFFISSKGEIATNRHVIFPNKNTTYISNSINDYLNKLKREINILINEEEKDKDILIDYYNENYTYLDFKTRAEIIEKVSNKKNKIVELEGYIEDLNFNPSNTFTELKRVFLGVAYDDTHVTTINDFTECVAIKKSEIEEVDLAIIQLENKTTPSNINHYLNISDYETNKLSINDQVYMIGFNKGIILAKTKNGIKSQFTQGIITQDPDEEKILYSIPTLPGSSGSPIIDKWGNLIAINFLKTRDYQGFSYGIPSKALYNLYNNNLLKKDITQNDRKKGNLSNDNKTLSIEKKSNNNYTSKFKATLKTSVTLKTLPNDVSNDGYKCPKNATVYVFDSIGPYYRVIVNGYAGYIYKSNLLVIEN